MKMLLITTLFVSCANIKPKYKYTYEEKLIPKKTVIQKLAECTEKYISDLGIEPLKALSVCEDIYRKEYHAK